MGEVKSAVKKHRKRYNLKARVRKGLEAYDVGMGWLSKQKTVFCEVPEAMMADVGGLGMCCKTKNILFCIKMA